MSKPEFDLTPQARPGSKPPFDKIGRDKFPPQPRANEGGGIFGLIADVVHSPGDSLKSGKKGQNLKAQSPEPTPFG